MGLEPAGDHWRICAENWDSFNFHSSLVEGGPKGTGSPALLGRCAQRLSCRKSVRCRASEEMAVSMQGTAHQGCGEPEVAWMMGVHSICHPKHSRLWKGPASSSEYWMLAAQDAGAAALAPTPARASQRTGRAAITKYTDWVAGTTQVYVLMVLEAGSLRSRGWQAFLLRPFSLVCGWLPSRCVLWWSFICVPPWSLFLFL